MFLVSDDLDDLPESLCLVGRHRHPGSGALCPRHLAELLELVRDVARMTRALGYHLMPASAGPAGEKVSTSRTGSPTPARLDVLSLIGPGGREVRRDPRNLAPLVRRWSTVSTYTVDGKARTMRDWHSEIVTAGAGPGRPCRCGQPHDSDAQPSGTVTGRPVLRMVDDQAGAIPPAEWMDEWVRRWRLRLAHGARKLPEGAWVDYATDADQDKRMARAGLGEMARMSRGRPTMMLAVAAFISLRLEWEALNRRIGPALLGLRTDGAEHQVRAEDALAGARPPAIAHDTAGAEWIIRYGAAKTAAAVEVDAYYLATWLPSIALLDDPDALLDEFVPELQALHSELQYVLGEIGDETRIGRCPVKLVDGDGNETDRLCGAEIRHDPQRIGWRIQCHRCHTSWPETQWLALASLIRIRHPIDTRRRYTAGDRRAAELAATMPTCRGCDRTMAVEWRRAPERGDTETWWRPVKLVCPAGCLAGGTTAAA